MKNLFILFISLITYQALAMDACNHSLQDKGELKWQTGRFSSGVCFISISPKYKKGLIYRSFLITTDGQFMIFNSFGDGPSSKFTGARVYYVVPETNKLLVEDKGTSLFVTLANGTKASFSVDDVFQIELEGFEVLVDPEITGSNQGGVEIRPYGGVLFDGGYKQGGSPIWNLKNKSYFINSHNEICQVFNKDVFKKENGELYFKFRNNSDLERFLKRKCSYLTPE